MRRYGTGAEWLKSGLPIQVPGAKVSGEYGAKDGRPDFDYVVHSSAKSNPEGRNS